jgi:hypothetical protein
MIFFILPSPFWFLKIFFRFQNRDYFLSAQEWGYPRESSVGNIVKIRNYFKLFILKTVLPLKLLAVVYIMKHYLYTLGGDVRDEIKSRRPKKAKQPYTGVQVLHVDPLGKQGG